jgi:carbamoyl-phosphate synthase/aspartate carbamoyltransferase
VPSRETRDELLQSLPAYFEANKIHIVALITASYSGEEYSHYLAESSLGTWLKEQGVPAMDGVDTRALTKMIRKQGSMLGKLLLEKPKVVDSVQQKITGAVNGLVGTDPAGSDNWRDRFETVDWVNPNTMNLVAEGINSASGFDLLAWLSNTSVYSRTEDFLSSAEYCF